MRATAQLDAERFAQLVAFPHADDADLIAVFFAEQRHGALRDGGFRGHEAGCDLRVLADTRVDLGLDDGEVGFADRGGLADVEAEAVGGVETALLCDVGAEAAAQGLVQEVGGGVMGADGGPPCVVEFGDDGGADGDFARLDDADMDHEVAGAFVGVRDDDPQIIARYRAGIANLAAGLRIEGGLVEDDGDVVASLGALHGHAANDEGEDGGGGALGGVALELGGASGLA